MIDDIEWIEYIVEHFIKPWGLIMYGDIEWQGECDDDNGIISINNNKVSYVDFEERVHSALLVWDIGEVTK